MKRLSVLFCVVAFSCAAPKKVHNVSKDELMSMHDTYFAKMGLSEEGRAEMRRVVGGFYDKISTQGEPLVRTRGHKFASKSEWLDMHQQYFVALGITEKTRDELSKAMSKLWDTMQQNPNDELVVAVRKMMEKFRGMPPCCSEDALMRAK